MWEKIIKKHELKRSRENLARIKHVENRRKIQSSRAGKKKTVRTKEKGIERRLLGERKKNTPTY